MAEFKDQLGRKVQLMNQPKRIISLVPSQTELLHYLGLEEEVIGITKFCIHPVEWFRSKQRVGGTKTVDIERVKALQPDLIIANKEENVQEQIKELETIAPVWISDVNDLNDALEMITAISETTNTRSKADELVLKITEAFNQLQTNQQPLIACYLIWKNPYMTVGGDTFINDMLTRAGFANLFSNHQRYPEITIEQIKSLTPAVVMLSSEPYPFKQKHVEELQLQLPGSKVILVDGEMFSWYGSRLLYAAPYLKQLNSDLYPYS